MKTIKILLKNHIVQYVVFAYVFFGIMLFTFGGIATYVFHGAPLAMKWVTAITAWTPTILFLLMFKKLVPNSTVKQFYKNAFKEKINIRLLALITIMQIIVLASSVFLVSLQKGIMVISLLDFSFATVASGLFFTLIQGPMGEETGWRGYLLPAVEKKMGVFKSSFLVSIIWAFWHAPIWFLSSGYSGLDLLKYIIVFVISITSVGFLIGMCYHLCKNLIIPIFIHFTFNFLGLMPSGLMLDLVTWYALFYFILAIGLFIYVKKWTATKHKDPSPIPCIDNTLQ